jgi:ABC-type sugar transport system ATPase subunit
MFVAGFLNLHLGTPPISFIDARHLPQAEGLGDTCVGVRPEDVTISATAGDGGVTGIVTDTLRVQLGHTTLFTIRVGEHEVHARVTGNDRDRTGEHVRLTFRRYHLFDKASGRRLRSEEVRPAS